MLEYKIITFGGYSLTLEGIIGILLTLLITKIVLIVILKSIKKRAKRLKLDMGRVHSLYLIIKYIVWTISILVCFKVIGIQMNALLTGGAALLVGIGFGLQNIFSDLVAGFAILIEGTIEINDVVEVNGVIGRVKKITLRQTEIITQDEYSILVPNHNFTSDNVINWSHNNEISRFHVEVGVAYGSDTDVVTKVLMNCMTAHPGIEKSPYPFVRFQNFGDSALEFKLCFWSKNVFGIENIKSDLRYKIEKEFRANNISIPFPQRDIHIINK